MLSAAPIRPAVAAPEAQLCQIPLWQTMAYRLRYESDSGTSLQSLMNHESQQRDYAFHVTLRGYSDMTSVEATGAHSLLCWRLHLSFLTFRNSGKENAVLDHELRADLQRPILLRITPQGQILALWFHPISKLARGIARSLIGQIEFVFPRHAIILPTSWKTHEVDNSGRYTARYRMDGNKSSGVDTTVVKTRLYYLKEPLVRPAIGAKFVSPTVIPGGSMTAIINLQRGQITSISGVYTDESRLGRSPIARSRTSISLSLTSVNLVSLAARRQLLQEKHTLLKASPYKLWQPPSAQQGEEAVERNALGSDTLQTLMLDLAGASGSASGDNVGLFQKFKALIYLHPWVCLPLGRVLATARTGGSTVEILANAFTSVGSPEAQAALCEAIHAHLHDYPALALLVPSLGFAPSPTTSSVRLVRSLAFHATDQRIAQTAQLILGAMAHSLAYFNKMRSNRILQTLIARLQHPASQEETRQFLLALGNAGAASTLPILKRYLRNPEPILRSTALFALRRIDSPLAGDLLDRALLSDSNADVRYQAAATIGDRPPAKTAYEALALAIRKERSSGVRKRILSDLHDMAPVFPAATTLIAWSARHDTSRGVRADAAGMISNK